MNWTALWCSIVGHAETKERIGAGTVHVTLHRIDGSVAVGDIPVTVCRVSCSRCGKECSQVMDTATGFFAPPAL